MLLLPCPCPGAGGRTGEDYIGCVGIDKHCGERVAVSLREESPWGFSASPKRTGVAGLLLQKFSEIRRRRRRGVKGVVDVAPRRLLATFYTVLVITRPLLTYTAWGVRGQGAVP